MRRPARRSGVAAEQALRDAADIVDGDRGDQVVPLVDVVDAEIVELDAEELVGDVAGGVEAERIAADQIALGLGELLLGRAVGRRSA